MPSNPKYGRDHQELRAYWATQIRAGKHPTCSLCPHPILPTDLWDLDHTDDGKHYQGPAHQDCNRREGARKKNRIYGTPTRTRTNPTSRNW